MSDSENPRRAIPKALRFEVFKRDSFTCQYCGGKAPDVVLHCDHIKPVAEGGETELLNLVTSCVDCNLGKGARLLDDTSIVERQRRQIEELEERRQQLEMILQWRDGLQQLKEQTVETAVAAIARRSIYLPNDRGRADLKRWINRYGIAAVLDAIDGAFDQYLVADEEEDWGRAFNMVGRFLAIREQEKTDPGIGDLLYIQGILRRTTKWRRLVCVDYLRGAREMGMSVEGLRALAKRSRSWEDFAAECHSACGVIEAKAE